jgi:hypothetical protein
MVRRFVIALATAVALVGPASAKWQPKPPATFLPGEMQGNWCLQNDRNKWDTLQRSGLRAGNSSEYCPTKSLWVVWSNGWSSRGGRDTCTFTEIDKLDRYVFYVRGICKSKTPSTMGEVPNEGVWHPTPTSKYEEVRELHLVDGALVLWRLPDV